MKFKVKNTKSNLVTMTFLIILCFITCIFWLYLKKYLIFSIYFILTLIIAHMFYFTTYYINNKYLIIKLGFLKIKINIKKIKKITQNAEKVIIDLNKIHFTLYPANPDIFINSLKKYMKE